MKDIDLIIEDSLAYLEYKILFRKPMTTGSQIEIYRRYGYIEPGKSADELLSYYSWEKLMKGTGRPKAK